MGGSGHVQITDPDPGSDRPENVKIRIRDTGEYVVSWKGQISLIKD